MYQHEIILESNREPNRIAIGSMYDSKRCFLVIAYSIYYIEYNIYRVYLYVYIRNLSSGVMPKALSGTHPSKLYLLIAGLLFLLFDSYFFLLVQGCLCKESHLKPRVSYAESLILQIQESRI